MSWYKFGVLNVQRCKIRNQWFLRTANQIPVIKNIISGEYQEKALELLYFDYDSGIQYNAGKLVICKSEIASILLPAPIGTTPKTLLDFIPEY